MLHTIYMNTQLSAFHPEKYSRKKDKKGKKNTHSSSTMIKFPVLIFSKEEETHFSFFNLTENSVFQMNDIQSFQDCRFVGSSNGWLLILNEKSDPFLLDIVSQTRFQLPKKQTFPHIQRAHEIPTGEIEIQYKDEIKSFCYSLQTVQKWLMVKAVLSANPSSNTNYAAITMYNRHCKLKLALCRRGDDKWTGLRGELDSYDDILCHENMLYALGDGPSVEIWELSSSSPNSKMIIQVSCPRNMIEDYKVYPTDLYTSRWYLVVSSNELLFVVRYVGEFVRYDGEVVYEADTLTEYSTQPLICPYKTVGFYVYKLDWDQKQWRQVESLDDVALFIGGNQSVALSVKEYPGLKASAIYFTDDYWDRVDEDIFYGGHDMGVFKLQDGSIEPLLDCDQERFEPPPFWIVPN